MSYVLSIQTLVLSLIICSQATASRVPTYFDKNNYVSQSGYKISIANTQWVAFPKETLDLNTADLVFKIPANINSINPVFSTRVDSTSNTKDLRSYMKKYILKYNQFGLEILGNKFFKINKNLQGYVVDLVNPKNNKQIRQVIYHKNKKAVILTCSDLQARFSSTLKDCNKVIKSFAWN